MAEGAAASTAVLQVNGKSVALEGAGTIGELLARLGAVPERVVVEVNGEIFRRGEGLDHPLAAGDVVEVVHFVGGGSA